MQSPMQDVHHNHVILTCDQSTPIRPAIRRKTESHSVAAFRKGSKQHVNHTHPSKYLQIFNDTQPNCQRRHWQDRVQIFQPLPRFYPSSPIPPQPLPVTYDSWRSRCTARLRALFIQCSSNVHPMLMKTEPAHRINHGDASVQGLPSLCRHLLV